ncbi:MAG: HTH-type transcriptional repressor YtrA [Firmicutes bacterium ADurb.Bin182]|nr:MAG: HTH-type transcriptional repressor YtrA [Firmicutes bacterium ADurb.Bin182]
MRLLNIIIANTADPPIYRQIADQIKTAVFRGEIKPGELLPSVRMLANELQISVITTRKAYEELEQEGLIVSLPGKGTFISSKSPELLNEARFNAVEERVCETIAFAKRMGVGREKLKEIINFFMEDENR